MKYIIQRESDKKYYKIQGKGLCRDIKDAGIYEGKDAKHIERVTKEKNPVRLISIEGLENHRENPIVLEDLGSISKQQAPDWIRSTDEYKKERVKLQVFLLKVFKSAREGGDLSRIHDVSGDLVKIERAFTSIENTMNWNELPF